MKGWIDTNTHTLYIFPQTADEIPYVDPSVTSIAVQLEDLDAWAEENSTYASLLVPYNYNLMSVRPKVWAEHTNDDIETVYTITITGDYASHFTLSQNTATVGQRVSVIPENAPYYNAYVTCSSEQTLLDWNDITTCWDFTMPAADVTVTTATATHTITITGDYASNVSTSPASSTAVGSTVTISATGTYNTNYTLAITAGGETVSFDTSSLTFTMPAYDVTITATSLYVTSYTFTIDEDGTTINAGSYEEGDSVQYTFDTNLEPEPGIYNYNYTMSPNSLVYNFNAGMREYLDESDPDNPVEVPETPAEISFIMPAANVTFTVTRVEES